MNTFLCSMNQPTVTNYLSKIIQHNYAAKVVAAGINSGDDKWQNLTLVS